MLRAIVTAADNRGCSVDPTTVVCDFEMAVINAVGAVLGPHVAVQGCFYHLCQSTWRRVQEIGLTVTYRQEDEVKLFCGMLDGLAFLPVTQVEAGMQFLRTVIPDHDGLSDLVDYFDSTYVTGSARRIHRRPQPSATDASAPVVGLPSLRLRRLPPAFPPRTWNVHDATLNDDARTNNLCESWNHGFQQLVGHPHPGVWTMIESLQLDQVLAATALVQHARGQLPPKRVLRATVQLQQRLRTLCCSIRDGKIGTEEFLRGVGHNVRLG